MKQHVPFHDQIVPSEHLKSQEIIEKISKWTEEKTMKLNIKKTKNKIFNFSKKYKFATQLSVKNEAIETVTETKLLAQ